MELILSHFPNLTERQQAQFAQLAPLYREWNEKINVISRKDIDNLYLHHILHSLAIAKVTDFKAGAHVLDLGTGGGLPGIPLAILFPKTRFTLVDGTRKKITVVEGIATALELDNVTALPARVEDLKARQFDFVLSRGVAPLDKLVEWSFRLIADKQRHAMPNGLLALKGGNVDAEIRALPRGSYAETFPISNFFADPYFLEKFVVYVQY
jgi:16S rRNA (guanine527-N7)-methyltransferase